MQEHRHNFYVFQIKADFEPIMYGDTAQETAYKRIEYAYMYCGCGEVLKKVRVKSGENLAE